MCLRLRLHRGIRYKVNGILYTGITAIKINEISVPVYIEIYAHNVYYTHIPINVHVRFFCIRIHSQQVSSTAKSDFLVDIGIPYTLCKQHCYSSIPYTVYRIPLCNRSLSWVS